MDIVFQSYLDKTNRKKCYLDASINYIISKMKTNYGRLLILENFLDCILCHPTIGKIEGRVL